jgi:hypothetical protein
MKISVKIIVKHLISFFFFFFNLTNNKVRPQVTIHLISTVLFFLNLNCEKHKIINYLVQKSNLILVSALKKIHLIARYWLRNKNYFKNTQKLIHLILQCILYLRFFQKPVLIKNELVAGLFFNLMSKLVRQLRSLKQLVMLFISVARQPSSDSNKMT